MAEDKPFEATARRLKKARAEGNVTRSSELNGVVGFVAAFAALDATFPAIAPLCRAWFPVAIGGANPVPYLSAMAVLVAIPLLACSIATLLCSLVQTAGPVMKPLSIDASRISPGAGFKKIFSADSALGAGRAFAGLVVASLTLAGAAKTALELQMHDVTPYAVAAAVRDVLPGMLGGLAAVAALFAAFDFLLQRRSRSKKLRMTFDELKREFRETVGDPAVRAKRKSLAKRAARGGVARVREASFVVANPDHVVIGLRYAPPETPIPVVVVALLDDEAARAKALARSLAIPIIENVALARALYAKSVLDEPIADEFFSAVARIVAALSEMT